MAPGVREEMVRSAVVLLAKRGPAGASFSEVLTHSGGPRGSIYHHFPDGKDQLIGAALELAGDNAVAVLASLGDRSAPEILDGFMAMWRAVLTRSDLGAGCSVLSVTVATDSPALLDRAGGIFNSWRATLAGLLARGGVAESAAPAVATLIIAASEGAVVLARAERSLAPFDEVHERLRAVVRDATTTGGR